jgi:hypothetical protein
MRIKCCVPFCNASRGDRKDDPVRPGMEWICSKHWQLVSRELKRRRSRLRRRHGQTDHGQKIDGWIWRRMKSQAIERAAGI